MQAEYVRVLYADTDAFKIPEGLTPHQAVLLSDAFPTGFYAADNCEIRGCETIAVWGAGPSGRWRPRARSTYERTGLS